MWNMSSCPWKESEVNIEHIHIYTGMSSHRPLLFACQWNDDLLISGHFESLPSFLHVKKVGQIWTSTSCHFWHHDCWPRLTLAGAWRFAARLWLWPSMEAPRAWKKLRRVWVDATVATKTFTAAEINMNLVVNVEFSNLEILSYDPTSNQGWNPIQFGKGTNPMNCQPIFWSWGICYWF